MSSGEPTERLGYLLKHAREHLNELTSRALAPYGVDGRELAVLLTLAHGEPASQQEIAQRLGVDRTTMVALLDTLEARGLVTRRPDASDRRRNIVELTSAGQYTTRRGAEAAADAERLFLAPVTASAAKEFKATLCALLT